LVVISLFTGVKESMEKLSVSALSYAKETIHVLNHEGLLLASTDGLGRFNVMTIGWGLIGTLWRRPFFLVAVRPSRYTHSLIEATGEFTVNVPAKDMEEILKFCGSVSGRDYDKFKEKQLTALPGKTVRAPIILECPINYECQVLYKVSIQREGLHEKIVQAIYPQGSYHTLYFGEILTTWADPSAKERIQIGQP
jgi:flavin reductase (DIM6/NTAB) family NADH-FMN oxidoreductase RutF